MQWKLFADLAEHAGSDEVAVDAAPGDTVGDALDALLASHPDLERRVTDDDGTLSSHVNVLRNGAELGAAGLGTELQAGDELALFPPVSGG